MSPASTRKGPKLHRYYRCGTRDKEGRDACPAKPLPAGAIEEFVLERIRDATADGSLVEFIGKQLQDRIDARHSAIKKLREKLPAEVADASANAAKFAEELTKFEGRARDLVEGKLRAETDRLAAAERLLAESENDRIDFAVAENERAWITGALKDFERVWTFMTPENRGRLLRALVVAVRVNEANNEVEVELVNFASDGEVAA